jgi:hypothetical protein
MQVKAILFGVFCCFAGDRILLLHNSRIAFFITGTKKWQNLIEFFYRRFRNESKILNEIFNKIDYLPRIRANNHSDTENAILVAENLYDVIERLGIDIKCDGFNATKYVFEYKNHSDTSYSMSNNDYAMFVSLFANLCNIPELKALTQTFVKDVIEQTHFIQLYEEF